MAEGLSNREIAKRLSLSEHTISNYLFKMYEKLGLSSRVEFVLYFFACKSRDRASDRGQAPVALDSLDDSRFSDGFARKHSAGDNGMAV